ncbi:MAG: CHAT domain-containing protein [Alphaproteobacteria bacterium]|nr:CHAT domain-containing protein [Alphaproteobacteria bacterium]
MHTVQDLVAKLEQAPPEQWEALWASAPVEGGREDWVGAFPEAQELRRWLTLRLGASPPGQPLPTPEASVRAVLNGDGGPAEAYVVIFRLGPLPPEAPLLPLLVNATGCALSGGFSTLSAWLVTRSTLARIAMGELDGVWAYQELPTREGRRHPELELLGLLDPLREHEELLRSGWLRLALVVLWPRLDVPAVPQLPMPEEEPDEPPVALLEALRGVGAHKLAQLVEEVLDLIFSNHLEQWADNPLLAELRRRALAGEPPPTMEALPEDFAELAQALFQSGEPEAARLAGLLLHAHGEAPELAAALVTSTARARDLPVLIAGFADTELGPSFEELAAACGDLPEALADALVAVSLPRHERAIQGMRAMELEMHRLESLALDPAGVAAHAIRMVRQIRDDRATQHAEVRPAFEALQRSLEAAVARLGDPSGLTRADIERAAAEVTVPQLRLPLLELTQELNRGPLDTIVLSLALLPALVGTEHEALWAPGFRVAASRALWSLGDLRLMGLRVALLDALIEAPGPILSRAELHFQRANTRRALASSEASALAQVREDLEAAAHWARKQGELEFLGDAVSSLAKLEAEQLALGQRDAEAAGRVVGRIRETLALPVPPERRAMLLQGLAHVLRATAPDQAVEAYAEAVTCIPPEDSFWLELQAERISALVGMRRPEEAAALVDETLAAVREGASATIIAMVHGAVGEVRAASGRPREAQEHLEQALDGVRGIDPNMAHALRLSLMQLAVQEVDEALFRRHFSVLRRRWDTLRAPERADLLALAHGAVLAGLLPREEVEPLIEVHAPELEGLEALRLQLRQAKLKAETGDTQSLGALLLRASEEASLRGDVAELSSNHGTNLDPETLQDLLQRSRGWGNPTMQARLLEHLGRVGEARQVLHEALAKHQSPLERLSCVHLLVTLFEDHQAAQRRRWCEELEELLEQGEELAFIRIDLAAALWMSADGDPSLLDRAWRHAQRALPRLRGERQVQQGHRILGRIAAHSTERAFGAQLGIALERARWLLGPHPLKPSELARLRLVCAQNLVVPGPLADLVSIELSENLLAEAETVDPGHEGVAGVLERCRWIRQRQGGGPVTADPHFKGPGDHLPDWLIAAVMGRRVNVSDAELAKGLDLVGLATEVRPDKADALCAFLIRRMGSKRGEAPTRALQIVHEEVKGSKAEDGEWPELTSALAKVKVKKRHPLMGAIEDRLSRSRGEPAREEKTSQLRSLRKGSAEAAHVDAAHGVALMERVRGQSFAPGNEALIHEARERLTEATRIAKRRGLPHYPDYLISLGNAWKMPPDEDVERALAIYDKAERLIQHPERIAKLNKVRADALLQRGEPEDLKRAFELSMRSARHRSGEHRCASLNSAAQAARRHPDWSEEKRLRRASELLVEAARLSPRDMEPGLRMTLELLGEWAALAPQDARIQVLKSELITSYPDRQVEIERPTRVPALSFVEGLVEEMQHPETRELIRVRGRLTANHRIEADPLGLRTHIGPQGWAALQEHMRKDSLVGDAKGMHEALAELEAVGESEGATGRAVARALLLAELHRLSEAPLQAVQDASSAARAACANVASPHIRAILLRELARIWSPNDHAGDPVRDFALTAELTEEVIALQGGEEHADEDTLELRARGLRYSTRGDLRRNLLEARRVYGVLLEKALKLGDSELAANTEHCLADVESQLGVGGRLARLKTAAEGIERALAMTTDPFKRAEYQSSLAWQRTRIAMRLEGEVQVVAYRDALALFDAVDTKHLASVHVGFHHRLNRTTCAASLAKLTVGRHEELDTWRRFLREHESTLSPTDRAIAQHNLANALLWAPNVTLAEFEEGLALCERTVKIRTLHANPRHHWETTLLAGGALVAALEAAVRGRGPLPPQALWPQARVWLRRALEAGKVLGPGEELADAAQYTLKLASLSPEASELMSLAEEAWYALERAAPYLLLHADQNEREATAALQVGLALSYRLSTEGVAAASDDLVFAYAGKRARAVLDWIARGHAVLRRPLRARLRRPMGASVQDWMAWLRALRSGDADAVARELERLHTHAPEFLQDPDPLAPTWRWLKGRPGAVAVFVLTAEPVSLALLLRVDERGHERVQALGFQVPPMPVQADHLAWAMSQLAERPEQATQLHELATGWARRHVVGPILRFLGAPPAALLWCPGPGLRALAPRALWGELPVVTSTSLALPDLEGAPQRPASTLFVLADPGEGPMGLRGQGQAAIEALGRRAAARGHVEVLASVGAASAALQVGQTIGHATPEALLENARDHDVIVVLAHGEAPTPAEAALLLLDESGQLQRLGVAELSARPEALTGATVLLLACESGRVGAALSAPGGIAGALIAAGARRVVAPLWPVQLSVARAVAEQVLEGLAQGLSPEEVLVGDASDALPSGPSLGPAPSLADQRSSRGLQRQAFVTWVG